MLSFRCAAARRAFGRFCLLGRAAFGTCNLRSGSTTLNNSVLSDNISALSVHTFYITVAYNLVRKCLGDVHDGAAYAIVFPPISLYRDTT